MSATDDEVGITAYATACLGFTGIIKHRFRDFQVNEVDPQGNVARLTHLEPQAPEPQASNARLTGDELLHAAPALAAAFADIAGPDNGQLLLELLQVLALRTAPSKPPAAVAVEPPASATAAAAAAVSDAEATAAAGPAPAKATEVAGPAPADAVLAPPTTAAAASASSPGSSAPSAAAIPSRVVQLPNGSVQVLLGRIDSKDTRRAVHEFFKTQGQLPPMVTEAEVKKEGEAEVKAAGEAGAEAAAPGCDTEAAAAGAGAAAGAAGAGAGAAPSSGASKQQEVRIRIRWHPNGVGAAEGGGRGGRAGRGGGGGSAGGRGQKRGRDGCGSGRWEGGHCKFTRFVMYKENMESQMAVGLLANNLHLGVNAFGYAGTKDKRGVTTQFMTAFMVEPFRLAGLNARLRGMRLGNFSYSAAPLQLGALSGNEFRVLMRGVVLAGAAGAAGGAEGGEGQGGGEGAEEARLAEACSRVSETGFINYFGLQRFGTGGTPTHKIGGALLRGEFEGAIRMIMSGRPGEKPEVAAARAPFLERGDAAGSLRLMPRWATAERAILEVLVRRKESGPGISAESLGPALRAVPNTLRMMYMHAYQSYLWNLAASERVRLHGVGRAVAGDLVLQAGEAAGGSGGPDMDVESGAMAGAEGGSAAGGEEEGGAWLGSSRARLAAVHVVTEAEAASGRWSVHDVVLPLPGSMVQYPQNSTAQAYFRAAAADGVELGETGRKAEAAAAGEQAEPSACSTGGTPAPTQEQKEEAGTAAQKPVPAAAAGAGAGAGRNSGVLKSLRAEFSLTSLTGDYRHVVLKPKGFEWKVMRYRDPNDDSLVVTDLERLVQQPGADGGEGGRREQEQNKRRRTEKDGEEASRQGLEAKGDEDAGQQLTTAAQVPGPSEDQLSLAGGSGRSDPMQTGGEGKERLPLLALSLRFQLPASCYATMFIRELTKQSTHKEFQAVLSGAQVKAGQEAGQV